MTTREMRNLAQERLPGLIRDNLELCEMPRKELAAEIGVEPFQVTKWMNGDSLPSLPAALAMAGALGVTVEMLALGEEQVDGGI